MPEEVPSDTTNEKEQSTPTPTAPPDPEQGPIAPTTTASPDSEQHSIPQATELRRSSRQVKPPSRYGW